MAQLACLGRHVVTRPLGDDDGGGPRRAVLRAWCPTVVLEAGNNAHVDVLAALLLAVALWDDHAIGDDHAIRARPLPWRPAVVLVGFTFALAAVGEARGGHGILDHVWR